MLRFFCLEYETTLWNALFRACNNFNRLDPLHVETTESLNLAVCFDLTVFIFNLFDMNLSICLI